MGELYRTDLVLWSAQQARALRSMARERSNALVDWENVAEEIEDLGKSQRLALASHIRTVIEHLMKLQTSPATDRRAGWRQTILRTRREIEDGLDESPSLRREVPDIIRRKTEAVRQDVAVMLTDRGEDIAGLAGLSYDLDQVLGPWLPD